MKTFLKGLFLMVSISCTAQESNKLTIKDRIDVVTDLAREPMLAEHPDGTIFLTGYRNAGSVPQLWKSEDKGKSWKAIDVGSIADGADGNSDVDLVIDSDGTIYFISMKFTKLPENTEGFDYSSMTGKSIAIGVSTDKGINWRWTFLSQNSGDDRPWVALAPNNHVHVIWNDGKGIYHRVSTDKGNSWKELPKVNDKGGSSHFAIGKEGQLAVRVAPLSASGNVFDEGIDLIRLSLDGGKSWSDVKLPGKREWSIDPKKGILRWVEPMGWDENNVLYYIWSENNLLKMGSSKDYGKTWNVKILEESDDAIYYPYMTIANGQIAYTWVSGFGEKLRHHAAVLYLNEENPETYRSDPLRLDIWSRWTAEDQKLATGGEYFPIISLSDGDFGMATPIQNRKENRFGFTWWRLGAR